MTIKLLTVSSKRPWVLTIMILMVIPGVLAMPFFGIFLLHLVLSGQVANGKIVGQILYLGMGACLSTAGLFFFRQGRGFLQIIFSWTTLEVQADGSSELHQRVLLKTWSCLIPLGAITKIWIIGPSADPSTEDITYKVSIEFADGALVAIHESDSKKRAEATAQKLASALRLRVPEPIAVAEITPLSHEQILVRFFGQEAKRRS